MSAPPFNAPFGVARAKFRGPGEAAGPVSRARGTVRPLSHETSQLISSSFRGSARRRFARRAISAARPSRARSSALAAADEEQLVTRTAERMLMILSLSLSLLYVLADSRRMGRVARLMSEVSLIPSLLNALNDRAFSRLSTAMTATFHARTLVIFGNSRQARHIHFADVTFFYYKQRPCIDVCPPARSLSFLEGSPLFLVSEEHRRRR